MAGVVRSLQLKTTKKGDRFAIFSLFGADKFETGQQKLAQGVCAHYPMLTFAVGTMATNFPDQIDDIGFFGQPGDDAATNGSTIWMPAATYIPKTTTGAGLSWAKKYGIKA